MLKGAKIDLKVMEREDMQQFVELTNKTEFWGLYESPFQRSKSEAEKEFDVFKGVKRFFIQRKDGTKIGFIHQFDAVPGLGAQFGMEIAYAVSPEERRKGYTTEAVNLLLDYTFLTTQVARVQARADVKNIASHRVLEKAGFTKEGTNRQSYFANGELHDMFVFSILRKEWKEPRILKASD